MSSLHLSLYSASRTSPLDPSTLLHPFATLELGPFPVVAGRLVLRPPRYADYPEWREVRMRNERAIARYWPTTDLSWAEQHTEWRWTREVNDHRHQASSGAGLSFVLELDGHLVGQVTLSGIDRSAGTAEIGVWADQAVARRDVAATGICAVLDHAFDELELRVVTAPVSTVNVPAAVTACHIGFSPEATMRGYSHVGGSWGDHDLLSVLAEDRPADGLLGRRLRARRAAVPTVTHRRGRRVDHLPSSPGCRLALAKYAGSRVRNSLRRRGTLPVSGSTSLNLAVGGRTVRCGVRDLDPGHSAGEVYVVAPSTTAEATAAVRHAVEHATRVLGLHRLTALAPPGDHLLAAAYAGAGLRREGTLRSRLGQDGRRGDLDLWARLADDPAAANTRSR